MIPSLFGGFASISSVNSCHILCCWPLHCSELHSSQTLWRLNLSNSKETGISFSPSFLFSYMKINFVVVVIASVFFFFFKLECMRQVRQSNDHRTICRDSRQWWKRIKVERRYKHIRVKGPIHLAGVCHHRSDSCSFLSAQTLQETSQKVHTFNNHAY